MTKIEELLNGDDDYKYNLKKIEEKHFDQSQGFGSIFTKVKNLRELLLLAEKQRGNLKGNDHHIFLEKKVDTSCFKEGRRYLYVKTEGILGVIRADEIPSDTKVYVIQMKENLILDGKIIEIPPSICVIAEKGSIVNEGTIILGEEGTLYENRIITAFAGLPTKPQEAIYWKAGSDITVQDVINKYGKEKYLNILPKDNIRNVLEKTSYAIP